MAASLSEIDGVADQGALGDLHLDEFDGIADQGALCDLHLDEFGDVAGHGALGDLHLDEFGDMGDADVVFFGDPVSALDGLEEDLDDAGGDAGEPDDIEALARSLKFRVSLWDL